MADITAPPAPVFRVEVQGSERTGETLDVPQDGLLVGRASTCDLVLASREISRRHVYFYPVADACFVKDLGSKNGVLVNGSYSREERLHDGDVVDLGPSQFVFRANGEGAHGAAGPRSGRDEGTAVPATPARLPLPSHPLAAAGLLFGALAYVHWFFGVGGAVLAGLAIWEMRAGPADTARAMAAGGLVLGLVGAGLSLWFAEMAPARWDELAQEARDGCRRNLLQLYDAVEVYRAGTDGGYPDGLANLIEAGLLDIGDLRCPGCKLSGTAPCAYLYLPPALQSGPAGSRVLACDDGAACHQGRGGHLLYDDGRVEWLHRDEIERRLAGLKDAARQAAGRAKP